MPPADDAGGPGPHAHAELLAVVRQAVAEVVARPLPLLVKQPWAVIGVSKSAWYRLAAEGLTPRPVRLDGVGTAYRTADLEAFVQKLKTV